MPWHELHDVVDARAHRRRGSASPASRVDRRAGSTGLRNTGNAGASVGASRIAGPSMLASLGRAMAVATRRHNDQIRSPCAVRHGGHLRLFIGARQIGHIHPLTAVSCRSQEALLHDDSHSDPVLGLALASQACVASGQATMGVDTTAVVYQDPPPPRVETYERASRVHVRQRSLDVAERPVGVGRRSLGARARRLRVERRSLGAPRKSLGVDRGHVGRVVGAAAGDARKVASSVSSEHARTTIRKRTARRVASRSPTTSEYPTGAPPPLRVENQARARRASCGSAAAGIGKPATGRGSMVTGSASARIRCGSPAAGSCRAIAGCGSRVAGTSTRQVQPFAIIAEVRTRAPLAARGAPSGCGTPARTCARARGATRRCARQAPRPAMLAYSPAENRALVRLPSRAYARVSSPERFTAAHSLTAEDLVSRCAPRGTACIRAHVPLAARRILAGAGSRSLCARANSAPRVS